MQGGHPATCSMMRSHSSAGRRLGSIVSHVCAAQDARIAALEAELAALKRERAAASGGGQKKPLAGIRVLEVANWLAAPVAGALMADMGADVIKVEAPTGDTMRYGLRQVQEPGFEVGRTSVRPSMHWPDIPFSQENRGKRSIAVDVGTTAGQSIVHRLAETADVFITNLLPERLERFHMNQDIIMALNPRLIYASVTGYGMDGASRNTPGFDLTSFQARGVPHKAIYSYSNTCVYKHLFVPQSFPHTNQSARVQGGKTSSFRSLNKIHHYWLLLVND